MDTPTLMIVEDDLQHLYLLERYLRGRVWRMVYTTRGENALTLAWQEKPNLILLDLISPGISGWDVLRALKADPLTRPIPVIICSELDEADRAQEAGAAAFLRKPINSMDFWDALGGAGAGQLVG